MRSLESTVLSLEWDRSRRSGSGSRLGTRDSGLILIVVAVAIALTPFDAGGSLLPPPAGEPSFGPVSLSHGYPIWYQDQNGLKLQLCLDQSAVIGGESALPCLTAEPFAGAPISFPDNFGAEAFYWAADTFKTFSSTPDPVTGAARGGLILFVGALEAGFLNLISIDGQQIVFARLRIRADLPVAGTYRVEHPFGQWDYDVTAAAVGREINESQDVGVAAAGDFAACLVDGPVPPELPGLPVPKVDANDRSIGPFLTAAGTPPFSLLSTAGDLYLFIPQKIVNGILTHVDGPVAGSPLARNVFRVELTNPPPGFFLDAAAQSNVIELSAFSVMGKVFNDAPNVAPVAAPDSGSAEAGRGSVIDVLANDTDVIARDGADPHDPANPANTNVHGLDRGALRIERAPGHGTAVRHVNFTDGVAKVVYTPAAGFSGIDSFSYITQDSGGLASAPADVIVSVEDLKVVSARVHAKFLHWRVEGTSTLTEVPGTYAPGAAARRSVLTGAQVVPPTGSTMRATALLSVNDAHDRIDVTLSISDLPPGVSVTSARIHAGLPGRNGAPIFSLSNLGFQGTLSGTLTAADLSPSPADGVNEFSDAVRAILSTRAYVLLGTGANPGGEIRGQIGLPNRVTVRPGPDLGGPDLGSAEVRPDGSWRIGNRTAPWNTRVSSMSAVSSAGIAVLDAPLRVR